jgi:hypothetical protein
MHCIHRTAPWSYGRGNDPVGAFARVKAGYTEVDSVGVVVAELFDENLLMR